MLTREMVLGVDSQFALYTPAMAAAMPAAIDRCGPKADYEGIIGLGA